MSRRALLLFGPAFVLTFLAGAALGGAARPGTHRSVAAASPAASPGVPASRTIGVSGVGTVTVTPDLAYVTFGVETTNANLAPAQSENATRMTAVLDTLKTRGIATSDLRTTGYIVTPQYDRNNKLTGYRVDNGVRATIRDLASLGATIDQVVAAGATRVSGISFDVANKDAALSQAREAAVNDARGKAEQYAKLVGGQLGAALTISEGSSVTPRTAAAPAGAPASGQPTTPIEAGESTITVTVQITYELR